MINKHPIAFLIYKHNLVIYGQIPAILCNAYETGSIFSFFNGLLSTVLGFGRMGRKNIEITPDLDDLQHSAGPKSNDVAAQEGDAPARDQWSNKAEFVLSCISLSVGLGNVWRFPYVAYVNGGGAFLIPYIAVLLLVGKPMYFMEIAMGQYHSQGPVKIWKRIAPIAKGIGAAQVVVCLFVGIFYVIIMAWTMYYFWVTLISACKGESRLPWESFCESEWAHKPTCISSTDSSLLANDTTVPTLIFGDSVLPDKMQSASQQYFDRFILEKFDNGTSTERHNLDNLGHINLYMLACLAGSWLIVFLSLVKGVKSSGKVVYITSTLPFIVLIILLGRGASLPNASEGMMYFINPDFTKLLNIQTWKAAAEQMFFSLGVSYGSLTMLGSYNKFNNNCYQDGLLVSILDSVTSVTAGLAMFSVLGYLAGQLEVDVANVVSDGPGLAFVTFPDALIQMPVPHLWAILFFIMLYTLGLGSEIGLLENCLTFFCDKFPALRTKKPFVAAAGCSVCFLVGLPFVTQGGSDLFEIFNDYAGGVSVLFISLFEVFMIMWIYGLKRFINNMKSMLGKSGDMSYYWRTAWIVLSPATLAFILVLSLVQYSPLANRVEGLPDWADGIGWGIAGLAIIQLPIWAVIVIYKAKGATLKAKIKQSLWPDYLMEPMLTDSVEMTDSKDKGLALNPSQCSSQINKQQSAQPVLEYENAAFNET